MHLTSYLERLVISQADEVVVAKTLHDCLRFPKTQLYVKYADVVGNAVVVTQEVFDVSNILDTLPGVQDVVAKGNLQDVLVIVRGLEHLFYHYGLYLELFDSICIERGRVPLLHLVQTSKPQTGRSVVVDIHDFVKALLEIKYAKGRQSQVMCRTAGIMTGIAVLAVAWGALVVGRQYL